MLIDSPLKIQAWNFSKLVLETHLKHQIRVKLFLSIILNNAYDSLYF
ncbi:hypothetical protein HD_1102 [[Haemophilus] ducreyi 35000HP]|uniref:Uncharacterized protein n=1 Tax=Haemophilus ducreyi (strain 35000HP / ATCC 700724) TaxID=233412 RepID=Q7VM91_HAEDU|nr:hypothetical protein HD_1102 [[Haemophilus] ducreyi 35000HP]